MVKKQLSFLDYFKSVYDFNLFKSSYSPLFLYLYIFLGLIVSGVLGVLIQSELYNGVKTSFILNFIFLIIGIPLLFFILYLFFYIFLRSSESNLKKGLFESYFITLGISIFFLILEYLIIYLRIIFSNFGIFLLILSFIELFLFIYYFYLIIRSLKVYFNVESYKIISALILSFITISLFFIFFYFSYMFNLINK